MTAHLIESTIVLLIAIAAAQFPRLAARTRFAIIYAGLMKFAVPSAIVAWMGIRFAPAAKARGVIAIIGGFNAPVAASRAQWPAIVWVVVAVTLFAITWLRARRAVAAAMHGATAADPRAHAALARIGCDVRLLQSPATITPVAVGIVRPVIIISDPSPLTDDELASILAHECAHVARRDNLLGVIESIAGCALWFHPLVWIARRLLSAAREEACDQAAVARAGATTYLSALATICRAAVAPPHTGVSCIGGSGIRKRMEAVMRFGTRRSLPHRTVVIAAMMLLATLTFGAGIIRASSEKTPPAAPITLRLQDADLVDVLHTFGKLANVKLDIAGYVHGKVNVDAHDVPWDEAMEKIVRDAGYTLTRDGDTYRVR